MAIRVVFMGTPEFSVASLDAIAKNGITLAGIVTAPDKPAGRGKKIQSPAVKEYALQHGISPILQPTNLKSDDFLSQLKNLNADLFVVVAFRMLPEIVWTMPPIGTINLHASLLPNYRGAAPINWVLINGEKITGATTFFIRHEIDTGHIIDSCEVEISESDNAGSLHDKLMLSGAELLVKTIRAIESGTAKAIPQQSLIEGLNLHSAPKIFKENCQINWNQPAEKVNNFIRGLSPYPAAWTRFTSTEEETLDVKIFDATADYNQAIGAPGSIDYSIPGRIRICCSQGSIVVHSLQVAGKNKMDAASFLLGFHKKEKYSLAV